MNSAKEIFDGYLKGFNREGIKYLRQTSPEIKRLESLEVMKLFGGVAGYKKMLQEISKGLYKG